MGTLKIYKSLILSKGHKGSVVPFDITRLGISASIVLLVLSAATLVYLGFEIFLEFHGPESLSSAKVTQNPPRPEFMATATVPLSSAKAEQTDLTAHQPPSTESSPLRSVFSDYTAGRLDRAKQTLDMLSNAKEVTPEILQAQRILSIINTIQGLYEQALRAQEQKMHGKALDCWNQILLLHMKLVGNHSGFFNAQAEKKIKELAFEIALDAYRLKNNSRARHLCYDLLRINPNNIDALELLKKINNRV